jgi:ABC-type Fe3+/spermidine/putrescine transport system ATPase subunit
MSLEIVNLSKRFKDKWVLRDVSFDVSKGEIFGLFGPTGAGKTTLLNSILGKTALNGGTISYNGNDITKLGSDARGFDVPVLSSSSIWTRLFGNGMSAVPDVQPREFLNRSLKTAKRLLVLDDPFCAMDASDRDASYEACRDAVRSGELSILFASSDLEQMFHLCDRVAVIVGGEIKQIGSPQEIYEMPASRVVAAMTGRNNLFAARRLTSSKAEVPEFHTLDGGHRLFAQRVERGSLGALNQNVTLAIRPEHISLSFGASFPADNLLKAKISRVQFLGATTLVELDADGLRLNALVLRLVGLNVGDECMVGLPPERILIFKD